MKCHFAYLKRGVPIPWGTFCMKGIGQGLQRPLTAQEDGQKSARERE